MLIRFAIRTLALIGVLAAVLQVATVARAADGVIEIDQTRALAGNVSAGDAPGYPVTISESGAYVLTSALLVSDPDLAGIEIGVGVSDVDIDLNGFMVSGPTRCSGSGSSLSCTPQNGLGMGVVGLDFSKRVTVRDGSVRGFGSGGVVVPTESRVTAVNVSENDGSGIACPSRCRIADNVVVHNRFGINVLSFGSITGNVVHGNLFTALQTTQGMEISANVVTGNGSHGVSTLQTTNITDNLFLENEGHGISTGGDNLVEGNVMRGNTQFGYSSLATSTGYVNNVMTGNGAGAATGGTNMASNVCDYSISCP